MNEIQPKMDPELAVLMGDISTSITNPNITVSDVVDIGNFLYQKGYRKAGKTTWHKIADGDFPKENTSYLCYVHVYGFDRHGNEIDGYGYSVEPFIGKFSPLNASVIAWAELSKYEE